MNSNVLDEGSKLIVGIQEAIDSYLLVNQAVPDNQQGELQGLLASITAIGIIIFPLLMMFIFGFFTEVGNYLYFPGSPFIISFVLIILCIVLYSKRSNKGESNIFPLA